MKIDQEKLQGHIEKAKFYAFFAAVAYTIAYNPQHIEEHMQKYLDEEHPRNMHEFIEWLYNKGDSVYTYELEDNKIMLSEYNFSNNK